MQGGRGGGDGLAGRSRSQFAGGCVRSHDSSAGDLTCCFVALCMQEETAQFLPSGHVESHAPRSCKDVVFLNLPALKQKVEAISEKCNSAVKLTLYLTSLHYFVCLFVVFVSVFWKMFVCMFSCVAWTVYMCLCVRSACKWGAGGGRGGGAGAAVSRYTGEDARYCGEADGDQPTSDTDPKGKSQPQIHFLRSKCGPTVKFGTQTLKVWLYLKFLIVHFLWA